jgi:hypothetical protein
MSGRANIFGDSDDLDISSFQPKSASEPLPQVPAAKIREVSEGASFRSREPDAAPPSEIPTIMRRQRRYTTGRNQQLNIKASPETVERFSALADKLGLSLAETLEHALVALEKGHKI